MQYVTRQKKKMNSVQCRHTTPLKNCNIRPLATKPPIRANQIVIEKLIKHIGRRVGPSSTVPSNIAKFPLRPFLRHLNSPNGWRGEGCNGKSRSTIHVQILNYPSNSCFRTIKAEWIRMKKARKISTLYLHSYFCIHLL